MEYVAIYQIECAVCAATPIVGIRAPSGQITATSLCSVHFFGERMEPDEWNNPKESTE